MEKLAKEQEKIREKEEKERLAREAAAAEAERKKKQQLTSFFNKPGMKPPTPRIKPMEVIKASRFGDY